MKLQDDLLQLLLETATSIHEAASEQDLAEAPVMARRARHGFAERDHFRPDRHRREGGGGREPTLAQRQGGVTFSRSLLRAAEAGNVAEISQDSGGDISQSMVSMKIDAALCVPIMLGPARHNSCTWIRAGRCRPRCERTRSAFGMALGRMASLALSNLKRIDFEKRQAAIDTDLRAAAVARRRWICPNARAKFTRSRAWANQAGPVRRRGFL